MDNPNLILSSVRRTETYYFACGGRADIYRGQWTHQSGEIILVAIKTIRGCLWNDKLAADRARQRFLREAHLWTQLHHQNITEFHGLTFEKNIPGLVIPYYQNGDLLQFLRKHPKANKLDLICQVAAGLEYLHTLEPKPVVHGNIKASNILVTDDGRACLTDFGLAKMLSVSGYTTTSQGGSCRWMSPEIMEGADFSPTLQSDIWAFGMTILEVFTGKVPFDYLPNAGTVIIKVSSGDLPQQPLETNNTLWAMLKHCWKAEPTNRPAASTLSIILGIMASQNLTTDHVEKLVDYLERVRYKSELPTRLVTADALVPSAIPD